ncbi:MAG: acyl-CoA thioesterase [Alicyclobacillus sp.]|nr:acyl-CoA thioesterase [Alicyclobacillus sp.]
MHPYRFSHDLRVRWAEVDAQRIVFNAHYLTYVDIAFAEYLRRGLQVSDGEMLHTVIARTTLNFRQPAHYDELLTIWVRTARIGRTSLTVLFCICRGEDVLAEVETTYVHVDVETGRPTAVPDDWREKMMAYEPGLTA